MIFPLLYPAALILLTTTVKTTPIDFPAEVTTLGYTRVVPSYTRSTAATIIQDKGKSTYPTRDSSWQPKLSKPTATSSYESERLAETQAELDFLNDEYSVLEEKLESALADVKKLVDEKVDLTFSLKMIRRKLKNVQENLNAEKLRASNRQGR
ncbi:hypothetical protein KR032_009970 [Drosophila birchii]|nr:hypothetical protein KR032_009970 [Drosophila birchii]